MKVSILILFIFIQFYSFSQSLAEREKITMEFKKSPHSQNRTILIQKVAHNLPKPELNE